MEKKTLDETYTAYMDQLLKHSDPGDALHHLYMGTLAPGEDEMKLTVAAMALPEEEIPKMILVMAAEAAHDDGLTVQFMGISLEYHMVAAAPGADAVKMRELKRQRRLEEHPKAVEVTRMYAACRDGRRWIGHRILTGPEAGKTEGPLLRFGARQRDEGQLMSLLRRAVSL